MLTAPEHVTWAEAAVLLAGLLAVGFLVSWVAAGVLKLARPAYIGVLAIVTAGASFAVAGATGTSLWTMVAHHWAAGLIGGLAAGIVTGILVRAMPATEHRVHLAGALAWEGIVYGVAEGVLLSGLPAFVVWQPAAHAGWSTAASWLLALGASIAMIVVHHLGYWDFRGRQLVPAVAGCGILTVAYLATGSLLAPALGHVLLHTGAITGAVNLPPRPRPAGRQRRTVSA